MIIGLIVISCRAESRQVDDNTRLAGSRPIKCSFFSAASDALVPTVWITLIVKKCLQRSVGFSTIVPTLLVRLIVMSLFCDAAG